MKTASTILAAAGAATAALCLGGVALMPLAASMGATTIDPDRVTGARLTSCGQTDTTPPTGPRVARYTPAQVANAAAIVRVGQQQHVPPRGWVIAVATALQESGLRNSPVATDHDSVGLFQQRPSQGWGTIAQLTDPTYAATAFYRRLITVANWPNLPVTVAAQAVQRSAFPSAYAKHEGAAAALVNKLTNGAANTAATTDTANTCAGPGQVTASGWTTPVVGPVVSGFRTPDRPRHHGVDLAVPKHTPIRAVAAGIVIVAACDPGTARVRSCNTDGGIGVPGCGWYVDIRHPGGIISRYCHQLVQPLVHVGDTVTAGQQIGWSGTSGNSSGPHVHFEIHVNNDDRGATGAINPVPFMRGHGAALGG